MATSRNRDDVRKILADMHFETRYYALYEQFRDHAGKTSYTQDNVMAALTSTGLDVRYHPREKFYAYYESHPFGTLGLHVAVPYATVEFILVLTSGDEEIGDPFPGLAYDVARLRHPAFEYDPPYPKIPFSTVAALHQIVQQGVGLFHDVRRALLVHLQGAQPS